MQTHSEKETGRLDAGADYKEKEGGLRVLTRQGVNKVADMLRARRQKAQEPVESPDNAEIAPIEKKEEGGALEPSGPIMAMALRSRNLPNRRRLACLVNGTESFVLVRDTGYYRQGEQFEVRLNENGDYEAAIHRSQPRFR